MADLPILRLVTLDNFKSFRDRVDVPMGRGVNVIAGENGSEYF
jgi:chromosome segregation ATPase